ncbi:rhodanese-like domain-containing protein [uncultured Eudoraea sp.]|uniref:rhodanese-like domain-containing protein n=1 Tax=uncultured Eudoraea sp. TaxID=1035614 RepID=UPI0026243C69|nr:rhodanese-like domain-containing protein [uncultured Eudoraea sp.]
MSIFKTLFGSRLEESDKFEILEVSKFKEAIKDPKVQLVDVRTAREYQKWHIGKAINIDFFNAGNFQKSFEKLQKDKPVYLYCQSGNRSQKAARKLIEMGFERIYDLKGGILRWH